MLCVRKIQSVIYGSSDVSVVTVTAAVAVIVNMSDCNHNWAYLHLLTSWKVIFLYTELWKS